MVRSGLRWSRLSWGTYCFVTGIQELIGSSASSFMGSTVHERVLSCGFWSGGLDEGVNEAILHAAFVPFGDIKDVNIPLDQTSHIRDICCPSCFVSWPFQASSESNPIYVVAMIFPLFFSHACGTFHWLRKTGSDPYAVWWHSRFLTGISSHGLNWKFQARCIPLFFNFVEATGFFWGEVYP